MRWYRDTKQDIPNTFAPDIIENEDFCIPEIIAFLDEGFMKRDDIPADILKRVDAEMEFQRNPEEKNIHNFFAPNIKNKWLSVNDIIEYLKLGSIRISQLTSAIAIRVDKLDEFNQYRVSKLEQLKNKKTKGV